MTEEERKARKSAANRRFREKHREKINAHNRECYAAKFGPVRKPPTEEERKATRRETLRRYRAKNVDKIRAYDSEYKRTKEDPVKRAKVTRASYAKHREKRKAELKAYHQRVTVAKRLALAGRPMPELCDVCGRTGKVHFDHCHKTGVFRGWLCMLCNTTLGKCNEDPAILFALIKYLEHRHA